MCPYCLTDIDQLSEAVQMPPQPDPLLPIRKQTNCGKIVNKHYDNARKTFMMTFQCFFLITLFEMLDLFLCFPSHIRYVSGTKWDSQ